MMKSHCDENDDGLKTSSRLGGTRPAQGGDHRPASGIQLYDSARREFAPFAPASTTATLYTCGNTPDDLAHVGHAATASSYDVLRRALHGEGFNTRLVRNVTDVDDDIVTRCARQGLDYRDVAEECTLRFQRSLDTLGLLPATYEPRVTSHISDIIRCVAQLEARGHGYVVNGTVFFDVTSDSDFGRLSHLDEPSMIEISSKRGADPADPRKRHPLDFILWQAQAKSREPAWSSPWGSGRPGWHIECTAMAMRHLGTTIDLHGGGEDLIYPHHECSAAQSEALSGRPLARHWMHVGMVRFTGQKMSKSLGNVVYIHDLLQRWEPAAVRLALLANHYRSPWEWDETLVEHATERLERWRAAGTGLGGYREVRDALQHDLDTPTALEILDAIVTAGHGVSVACETLLGVRLVRPRIHLPRKVAA